MPSAVEAEGLFDRALIKLCLGYAIVKESHVTLKFVQNKNRF